MSLTWTEIIARFQLQVDDSSELSSDESLVLANEIYTEIQNDRNWEWLKKTYSGTTSTTVPYVALPTDFKTLSPNKYGTTIIFIGSNFQEYKVVPYSNRRQYRDTDGYCYLDIPNSRLYFTKQPTSAQAIEYDYVMVAPELTTATSPLFIETLHDVISYWMASKFDPIQLTNQGESYQRINTGLYWQKLTQLRLLDAKTKLAMS